MSCKGLVELIVLNIGLQAGILDTRLFSMFVIHAIILTFITTPLTIAIYPARLRKHFAAPGETIAHDQRSIEQHRHDVAEGIKTRFTIILHKMEYVPIVMTLVQYLQPPHTSTPPSITASSSTDEKSTPTPAASERHNVSVEALRLIELTQRTSDVMKGTNTEELAQRDPLLSVFRTFGHLNRIAVSSSLSIVPQEEFSNIVAAHARSNESDLVVIPWSFGSSSSSATDDLQHASGSAGPTTTHTYNPFGTLFGGTTHNQGYDKAAAVGYSHFIRRVFAESPTDVALFIDIRNAATDGIAVYGQHIFLPFFGGPDDRLALAFVVQLCEHPAVSATVIRVQKTDVVPVVTNDTVEAEKVEATSGLPNLTVMSVSDCHHTFHFVFIFLTRHDARLLDSQIPSIRESRPRLGPNPTRPITSRGVSTRRRLVPSPFLGRKP